MLDKLLAKFNPARVFKTPSDVLTNDELTREEKIDILRRWAYDERELEVADEENMLPTSNNHLPKLDLILEALLQLGVTHDEDDPPPTKQG